MIPFFVFLSFVSVPDDHARLNPLYQQLCQTGVPVSKTNRIPLPAPQMPDGLKAGEQEKILRKLLDGEFNHDDFVDNSVNAPVFLMPLKEIDTGDPKTPAFLMNLYFVVHGDINKLVDRKTYKDTGDQDQGKAEARELTAEELKARNIILATDSTNSEGYGRATINIMDRVKLEVVGHGYLSKSQGSIVVASEVAEAFQKDKTYPNQWSPLKQDADNPREMKPQPYSGAGYYLKLTPLLGVPGASFVECHVVFTEPKGWFNGQNLLRSKLPAVTTNRVRKFRADLKKGN